MTSALTVPYTCDKQGSRFKVVASSFMLTIHLSILQASQSVKFKLS